MRKEKCKYNIMNITILCHGTSKTRRKKNEVVCPDQVTTQIGETGHVNLELEAFEKSHYVNKDD